MSASVRPTLHLNGSSAYTLRETYAAAMVALGAALDALEACAPNARDYYPQGDQAILFAAREHSVRVERVRESLNEVSDLYEHVVEREEEIARARATR